MDSIVEIEKRQAERIKKYPANRIPFWSSKDCVDYDKNTFVKYEKGILSIDDARMRMAKNNYLKDVTVEQFLTEFDICGYSRLKVNG